MAKKILSTNVNTSDSDQELEKRSSHVKKQLHIIGLIISVMMFVVTLILLGMTLYKIVTINNDFKSGNVTYSTANGVNQLVAWLLLMIVTSMTGLIFFRLYQEKPPFSKGARPLGNLSSSTRYSVSSAFTKGAT